MKRTQRQKERRNLVIGFGLTILSVLLVIHYPLYVDWWQYYSGIVAIALVVIAAISPVGNLIVGDKTAKLAWPLCWRQILFSYGVILLFMFSLLLLFTTTVGPESSATIAPIIVQNIQTYDLNWIWYPWSLYALGVLLVGVIGYQVQRPKMSGALQNIIPKRYVSNLLLSIIDFMAILGFYIGMLALVALVTLQLAKLMSGALGFPLDYKVSLNVLGLGFALMYLPFSQVWKKSAEWLQNKPISPGFAILILLVGLSIFILFIYGVLYLFLLSFADYYAKVNESLVTYNLTQQIEQLSLTQIIWGFSMVSTAVMAGWWAHLVQGYTLRQALVMLLSPMLLILIAYLAIFQSGWISSATIESIILALWSPPFSYLISLLAGVLLAMAFWRETNFVKGLFWVMPNLTGRKLGRLRKTIIWGSAFVTYTMMVSLLGGIFFVKVVLLAYAVMFSFILILEVFSTGKFIFLRGKNV